MIAFRVRLCVAQDSSGGPSNPMNAAAAIVDALPSSPMIESTSVAPGGFINIRLRPAFINQGVASIIRVSVALRSHDPLSSATAVSSASTLLVLLRSSIASMSKTLAHRSRLVCEHN